MWTPKNPNDIYQLVIYNKKKNFFNLKMFWKIFIKRDALMCVFKV